MAEGTCNIIWLFGALTLIENYVKVMLIVVLNIFGEFAFFGNRAVFILTPLRVIVWQIILDLQETSSDQVLLLDIVDSKWRNNRILELFVRLNNYLILPQLCITDIKVIFKYILCL